MCRRLKLRRFLNRDVKPERLELPDMPSNGALAVALVEIVGPELVIGAAIAHDVVRDFKDLMAHRDDGLLVAAMPFDAMVPRLKRRPVASGGRQAGLNRGAAQIPVALPRLPAAPFAGTFVLPGSHCAPATQMFGRGKPRHVASRFSHDGDRADPIDTGNRVQGGQRRFERDQSPIDFRRQTLQRLVEKIDLRKDLFDEKRMARAKATLEDAPQVRQLSAQPAPRQVGSKTSGSVVPSTSARSIARPLTPMTSVITLVSFRPASSKTLHRRFTCWLRSSTCCTR
jgi:hypothetical protein